jgi:hypothetical protein
MQPYALIIQPQQQHEVVVTLVQQVSPATGSGRAMPLKELGKVTGLPLVSIHDDLLEALRANQLKPFALSKHRLIELNEASGIRLALLFKTIAPFTTVDDIRAVQQGIAAMSDELSYYWFSQCYGAYGDRATRTLRILLGAETT